MTVLSPSYVTIALQSSSILEIPDHAEYPAPPKAYLINITPSIAS